MPVSLPIFTSVLSCRVSWQLRFYYLSTLKPYLMPCANAGAHKAAAHKATTGPQQGASQLQKGHATRQDVPQAPSFAASAVVGRQPAAQTSVGVLGRLLNRLRPSLSAAHASDSLPSAPSFAAAPVLKGQQPQPQQREPGGHGTTQPNAVLYAARRLAMQASATASNPLYRFAKLGGGQPQQAAAAGEGPAANKENLGALKKYAEIPQKPAGAGASQSPAGGPMKRVAQRALDAKALLRYAKLK
jgi:hypothetical protein